MSRIDAVQTEESSPMSKWLVLPMIVLAYVAATAGAATPRDRDRDGLPDGWERTHQLSTAIASAKKDPDHDRLSNRRERRLRTHPRRADTDRDRLRDGAEVRRFHTNPRKRDTDGDGYSDRTELRKGTNPRKRRSHPRRKGSKPPRNFTPPPAGGFPNPASTGVPAGWMPKQTRSSDLTVNRAGAVIQDVLLTNGADLLVNAPNVTIRRVKLQGGVINNWPSSTCKGHGLLVEDTTLEPAPGQPYVGNDTPALMFGGYTARRVEINRYGEGFRVADCGRVTLEDSFVYILGDEPDCGRDLHSDGAQAFYGQGLTANNNTIIFGNHCGTSPYFMGYGGKDPSRPTINTGTYNINGLLVAGGGYVFRQQVPGSVTGLRIVHKSWLYGPIDNRCSVLSPWDAKIVTIDENYQVTRVVRNQPCNTDVVE
jgi:hypothetical protein